MSLHTNCHNCGSLNTVVGATRCPSCSTLLPTNNNEHIKRRIRTNLRLLIPKEQEALLLELLKEFNSE